MEVLEHRQQPAVAAERGHLREAGNLVFQGGMAFNAETGEKLSSVPSSV